MVGYDSQNNALTLGDDDSLKVGEYELQYDSTSDEFQAEYEPTGDTKSIPRSTSGSLVPQGLADVVSQGEVLADNGEIYTSVQTAVDNSSGFVFIGPGTFNENVTISTQGMTVQGSGYDTFIDGGTINHTVQITQNNVTLSSVRLSVDSSTGYYNIEGSDASSTDSNIIKNCVMEQYGQYSVRLAGNIFNCRIPSTASGSNDAIQPDGHIVANNRFLYSGDNVVRIAGDDCIISNNVLANGGRRGVYDDGKNDNIIIGNRIYGNPDDGVKTIGIDNIVANNRISGSTNNINDNGTGTVLDDNLTGPSN